MQHVCGLVLREERGERAAAASEEAHHIAELEVLSWNARPAFFKRCNCSLRVHEGKRGDERHECDCMAGVKGHLPRQEEVE